MREAEYLICAIKIHICLDQACQYLLRDPFSHRHMFRGFKSAGEPSLRYELAKSLHAGDITVLRTFGVSPTLWQFVVFAPFPNRIAAMWPLRLGIVIELDADA